MLAGPDKSGKSTLLAHGAASLTTGGPFLGERCKAQRVLWLGLEEAPGDAVRRFHELGADGARIKIVTRPAPHLLARTRAELAAWDADLVVVDSLSEYARVTLGAAPDDGDNAGWGAVVRPLVSLARDIGVAVVVLHHVRKSDGEYRGATEIAAATDALLVLSLDKDDPTVRRIKGRGRWPVDPFAVALRDGRYELAGAAPLSTDALVLLHVEENPGASMRSVRDAVGARASVVDATVNRLLASGAIVDRGRNGRRAFHPAHQTEIEVAHVAG